MQGEQVDKHIDERVLIRGGLTIPKIGVFNAPSLDLGVSSSWLNDVIVWKSTRS